MFDNAELEMEFENYLIAGKINLEDARDIFTKFSIQSKPHSESVSAAYVGKRKVAIGQRMMSAFDGNDFPLMITPNELFENEINGETAYNFKAAFAPLGEIVRWARQAGISMPDDIYKRAVSMIRKNQISAEPLTGKEKQELGRLRVERAKWDESIQAAVVVGRHYANHPEGKIITRDELFDYIHEAGYKTLPNTTIGKIWKALPEFIRSKGGRTKGSKDVH